MLKIILSEMHHSLTKWEWAQWVYFYCMLAGCEFKVLKCTTDRKAFFSVDCACSLVTVYQPPVLTTTLGHDVVMSCELKLSHDEDMVTSPVLYWLLCNTVNLKVWTPTEKYIGRVDLLDNNPNSSNKSILLKNVQWADSGRYLCKVSVNTNNESYRRKGNETVLMVYDTVTFDLTSHNDSLLWCGVNVTRDPGFVLSVFHDGCKLQTVDSAPGDAAAAPDYVTLSETVSPRRAGKYECQLHLNKDLITKSIFYYRMSKPAEGEDAEMNGTLSPTVSEPGEMVFPEPWLLYAALLLVPIIILLGLITVLLLCRS